MKRFVKSALCAHNLLNWIEVFEVRLHLFLIFMIGGAVAQTHSVPVWRSQVDELKAKGDATGALARLEEVAHTIRPTAALEDEMGFLLVILNRRTEAIERFRNAVGLDSKFAAGYYHLGVALWIEGKQQEAVGSLAQAARLGPRVFDYRYRYGRRFSNWAGMPTPAPNQKRPLSLHHSTRLPGTSLAWLSSIRAIAKALPRPIPKTCKRT